METLSTETHKPSNSKAFYQFPEWVYHSVRRSKPARRKFALFHTFTPTRGVTITYISHTFYVFLKTIYTSSRTGETVVPWSAAYIYEEVIRPEGYRLRRHMHLHKRPPRKKVAPIPSVIED